MTDSIKQHYDQQLDAEQIIKRLRHAYPDGPNVYQLAPVDQLHIGGIKASLKLLQRIKESGAKRILDIGSGLGGLMRLLERETGRSVIGVDITHELNKVNRALSALTSDSQPPFVITADAHHLPFGDAQFDLVLFQHSLLNMPDDIQVLSECQRVLSEGGQLLLHEVIQGPEHQQMCYPVPWARDPQHSHLLNQQQLTERLRDCGFQIETLNDWSEEALNWRKRQSEKEREHPSTPATVSPALILGPEFLQMGRNVMNNLEKQAACVIELSAKKLG